MRDIGEAETLWGAVHAGIKAETSRSAFIDCFHDATDRRAPDAEPGEFESSPVDQAFEEGEVPSDNVLVRDGSTDSVADRRDDGGILAVDVRVERAEATSATTVLFADSFEDPHWSDPSRSGRTRVNSHRRPIPGSRPERTNERNCTLQVEVTAGTHLDVFIDDIPSDGGDCPHETGPRPFGF